jgi:hypothetical protein
MKNAVFAFSLILVSALPGLSAFAGDMSRSLPVLMCVRPDGPLSTKFGTPISSLKPSQIIDESCVRSIATDRVFDVDFSATAPNTLVLRSTTFERGEDYPIVKTSVVFPNLASAASAKATLEHGNYQGIVIDPRQGLNLGSTTAIPSSALIFVGHVEGQLVRQ